MRCETKVTQVLSGETFKVEGDHTIRLIGVDAPAHGLSWSQAWAQESQAALEKIALGQDVTLTFDDNRKNARFETLAYARTPSGAFLNQEMLKLGLGAFLEPDKNKRFAQELRGAEEDAKKRKAGFWRKLRQKKPTPTAHPIKGFSLGLYSRDDNYDYQPFLREQVAIGATDILLITPWFLDHFTSCEMVPKKTRSTSLPMVGRVIRQAKSLGLRVAIMPIVLLWKPTDDHWRGDIKPKDQDDWFLSYQEFMGAFASLAEENHADELLVGSEFSSLERDEPHWRQVIRSVRRRFSGLLSYSANWDHLNVIQWWDDLDAIGMTGYHSLTKKDDPSIEELTQAWRRVRKELEMTLANEKKPYFFSEMGYASLDGINKDPWDYVSPQKVDWKEQADCYEAWFRVWQNGAPRFRGAFFYTWWRNKDKDDKRQYTVHGKPACEVIKKWYKKL